ncbi:(4Fe-4S)-binding protein [Seonamhaeicola sediminis]|uniref:(4Fe-4S)-binding protein n=1 Tax=Seonamhaeicola sediminis TaxID=2528206 RepID=A0A562YHN6_9FLAO|nr:(4Fe-4S)-binding protein [Seonamhaeicola sediminis]TWO34278.1 (4Fe-4S)-binding protein [Seonamhaeicola sediminis]
MEVKANEFSNKDITVTYDPCKCILSGTCAKELSDVFSNSIIPWVNLDHTETKRIIEQVKRCPSGALHYFKNKSMQAS